VGRHLDAVLTGRADNKTTGSQHLSFHSKFKSRQTKDEYTRFYKYKKIITTLILQDFFLLLNNKEVQCTNYFECYVVWLLVFGHELSD